MYFSLIQLFLIIVSDNIFAFIYNNPCTTKCDFPGMICAHSRCVCDYRINLFWTGVRCGACPKHWSISETACIVYYGTPMIRAKAEATCHSVQGDLISLRDNNILPLIYQVTGGIPGRKKRTPPALDPTTLWTSAQAIQLINLGLYQWSDKSIKQFDSTHNWWCKRNVAALGYPHGHNEPTRFVTSNDSEKCVLLRRGKSTTPFLCLDDVFCSDQYPFLCEKSESTFQKFHLSSSSTGGYITSNSKNATNSSPHNGGGGGGGGGFDTNKDPNLDNEHHLGMLAKHDKDNTKTIIIILIIALLLLATLIAGVCFFKKKARATATHSQFDRGTKRDLTSTDARPSTISGASVTDTIEEDEISSRHSSTGQDNRNVDSSVTPSHMDMNIDNQQQQKNKRHGYSKQKFDEFE